MKDYSIKRALPVIGTLLVGIVIGLLVFYAYFFKFNYNYLKFTQIQICGLQDNMDSYFELDDKKKKLNVLKKDFEKMVDSFDVEVLKDSIFYKNKGNKESWLNDPINDQLYTAYRKTFYYSLIGDSNQDSQSIKKRNVTMNPWVWISKENLLKYASLLYNNTLTRENINGVRIYFGKIDTKYIDESFISRNDNTRKYFQNRQGMIMPLFVFTQPKMFEDGIRDIDFLPALNSDCNCGNPPGGGRYISCNVVDNERRFPGGKCSSNQECERCNTLFEP